MESPDEEQPEAIEQPEGETPAKEIKSVRKKETPVEETEKAAEQPAAKILFRKPLFRIR